MTSHDNEPGHGHSVAAWFAVIVAIIGTTLATVGVVLAVDTITIAGVAITGISIFVGPVLAKLGYGVAGKSHASK